MWQWLTGSSLGPLFLEREQLQRAQDYTDGEKCSAVISLRVIPAEEVRRREFWAAIDAKRQKRSNVVPMRRVRRTG